MSKAQNSTTNRRHFLRLAGATAAATALLAAPALAATPVIVPAAAVPDPLIALGAAVRKADRRWTRACDARDEAEKASGGPYWWLPPRVVVANYECGSPREVFARCQPHNPTGPTLEEVQSLAAELRRKITAYRRRRRAAGLGPFEREIRDARRAQSARPWRRWLTRQQLPSQGLPQSSV
jgi:hypothetical protein